VSPSSSRSSNVSPYPEYFLRLFDKLSMGLDILLRKSPRKAKTKENEVIMAGKIVSKTKLVTG
jgi:hypothetical protein